MSQLTTKFFNRQATIVARDLLGKFLCVSLGRPTSKLRRRTSCYVITEVEAYDGPDDKASHAHRGRTSRNEPMFGEAGRWYVYLVYGMHWMLNIVTGPKEYPAAVLIRGLTSPPHHLSLRRRGGKNNKETPLLTKEGVGGGILNGPGKITKFLKIDKRFNGKFASRANGLWIESASRRRGVVIKKSHIIASPRIGVHYAKEWKDKPYRFVLQ